MERNGQNPLGMRDLARYWSDRSPDKV
jgi:hypothetical protein